MFSAILISVVTLAQIYLYWRTNSVPFFRHHIPRRNVAITGIILWLVLVAGRFLAHSHPATSLAHWLELIGMTWLGTLLLLTTAMLAMEVITGFGFLLPCLAPPLRGFALFVGTILSIIALIQGLRPPVVKSYEVTLPGLPRTLDGAVVVDLSDLHLGTEIGENWLDARLEQVKGLKPDLVTLTGDIFEGHGPPRQELIETMRELKAPLGVWGVAGNHEFYGGPETLKAMQESGITLLRDNWTEIRPGLVIAGVEDRSFSRRPEDGAGRIKAALANHPQGAIIFLSHKPSHPTEAAACGVGLMLSGHTHGGQIWPFNYLVKHFYPYLAGRFKIEGMTLLVSRGTGTWGPRMRLWMPGEILKITLRTKHAPQREGQAPSQEQDQVHANRDGTESFQPGQK